ncbi:hypothetical protein [Caudoviricetes sp.]|nr:hypothetical protein [Caudoviricetes sp.]
MAKYKCGFFVVNDDHCWRNGRCIVCKIVQPTNSAVKANEMSRNDTTNTN